MTDYKFYSEVTLLDENNEELYKFIQASDSVVHSDEEYVLHLDFLDQKKASISTAGLKTPKEFKKGKEIISKFCKIDRKIYSINQITTEREELFHNLWSVLKKWNPLVQLPTNFNNSSDNVSFEGYIRVSVELEEEEVND